MNQMFPWVEGAEKSAEMNHRPLTTMTWVEILVAVLTLVSILEIPTHIPSCAAQAQHLHSPKFQGRPVFRLCLYKAC
jgi:hypothetical protein